MITLAQQLPATQWGPEQGTGATLLLVVLAGVALWVVTRRRR